MAEEYKVHIQTTADPSGAEITQEALEQTAQAGDKIVDAVTKGDRATANFVAKLKGLSPEQLNRVEQEMRALATAEEAAGRDASALHAQLERVAGVNVEKQAKNFAGMFGSFTAAGLATQAISSVTNAVREHLHASIELADQLDDLSARSGVSATALQTIGNAASLDGGSIDVLAASLSKLTVNTEKAIGGSKPLAESFQRLGISTENLKNLSPDELFYRLSDAVASSSDRGRTYADVVAVMGKGSVDLFATMEKGGAQIRATGEAMGVFSDDTVKALAAAKDSLAAFQNQLTIASGSFISGIGKAIGELREKYADADSFFTDFLYGTTTDLAAFDEVQKRRAQATENATKKTKVDADTLDELGDAAGGASDDLEKLNQQFADRARAKLPLGEQVQSLRREIERVRAESEKALPGLKFADANALFELSKMSGLSKETRVLVSGLALEYAGLEDKVQQVATADQKAQPDRLKRLEEIRVELAKPNVPIAARNELLKEELKLLGDIKKAAEERNKGEAEERAAHPPKPVSSTPALERGLDRLEAKSARDPSLDQLKSKLDQRVAEDRQQLATTIQAIPRSIGEIAHVAKQGFDDIGVSLELLPEGIKEASAPIREKVLSAKELMAGEVIETGQVILELGSTMSIGLSTIQGNVNAVQQNLQRQITSIDQQLGALWRAV